MYQLPTLQELLEAGVHFGHQVRRGHPRMRPYIYGTKDGVSVIDLTQTEKYLKEASEYVYNLGKENKTLLFVGTKKQARPIVEQWAKQLEAPYLAQRWIGGFLTNLPEIQKNIKKLKEYLDQKAKGELAKYTKKEQLLLERKMSKLQKDFAGVMEMENLPDAVFVVDAVSDNIAIREANRLDIPIIAIADSNCDPTQIDYPVPGNDDAIKSIKILVGTIASVYKEGKKAFSAEASEKQEAEIKEPKVKKEKKADEKEEAIEQLQKEAAAAEETTEKAAVKEAARVVE